MKTDNPNVIIDKLKHVLISCQDKNIHPFSCPLFGQSRENIVRFKSCLFKNRDTEILNHVFNGLHLMDKIVRHRFAMGFIFFKNFMTEGLLGPVKTHGQKIWFVLMDDF